MAKSLAMVMILGLLAKKLFEKIRLPGLLGILILGMLIGPYGFNLLDSHMINISADLRKLALVIILLRAGLGIAREDLYKNGLTALKMSSLPAIIEGFSIALLSIKLLDFSFIEGGILGFIIAAVSPAIVVPSMLGLIENRIGEEKAIPTLILAGASIDDVFAITIFTAFLGLYGGSNINIGMKLLNIPVSIFLGVLLGGLMGIMLIKLFGKFKIRDTEKVLVLIGVAIFLTEIENLLKGKLEIASLLGVMAIGFIIREKSPSMGKVLGSKLNKIWVLAEILLFSLVGAEVNTSLALEAGKLGIIIILIGLIGRSIGVMISLLGTDLNWKERLFCIISYIPKATVQAAIGGVPLAVGVESGDIILALAVLSIIITAPLGAIGIDISSRKLI